MLTADDIIRIKEIADIIRESGAIEYNMDVQGGTCVDEDSIIKELSQLPEEEKNNLDKKDIKINTEEIMIIYSLALKRFVIEKFSEVSETDINAYVKAHGKKQKTRMRAVLNSSRFKQIYEACYGENIRDSGVDSVFEIPRLKEEVALDFLQFLNLLYMSFIESHNKFKNEMIKISKKYYMTEKEKKIDEELKCINEFLEYYNKNRSIFNDDKLADTINEAGVKYGPTFLNDIHPVLYVYSKLLSIGMEPIFYYNLNILIDWLRIRYDDKADQIRIASLYVKMFYNAIPAFKRKANFMAEQYKKELSDLLESEKKNNENIRQKLAEENIKLKEERKKDDVKLFLRKKINSKKKN